VAKLDWICVFVYHELLCFVDREWPTEFISLKQNKLLVVLAIFITVFYNSIQFSTKWYCLAVSKWSVIKMLSLSPTTLAFLCIMNCYVMLIGSGPLSFISLGHTTDMRVYSYISLQNNILDELIQFPCQNALLVSSSSHQTFENLFIGILTYFTGRCSYEIPCTFSSPLHIILFYPQTLQHFDSFIANKKSIS